MSTLLAEPKPIRWPEKHDLFGVKVSATTYDEVLDVVIRAAQAGRPSIVSFFAVHAVITASQDERLREIVNDFDIVAPDGKPVWFALNRLYQARLPENCRGPSTMWKLCERAAQDGVSIYLYGGAPDVVEKLAKNLRQAFPKLIIAGYESPPYRPLTVEEDVATVDRINDSGAGLVFIGLGCPKQDWFAAAHKNRIRGVQLCVGASFDFFAGTLPIAPLWMQRIGLEWSYRLCQEPRRLWKRYLVTNTIFLWKFFRQGLSQRLRAAREAPTPDRL
jgi:exopolysaccharide biosynthesis WecB/TagA/CpsF family protein